MIPADDMPESGEPLTAILAIQAVFNGDCLLRFRTPAERDLFIDKARRSFDAEGLAYVEVL
jgi:hypothetical protein